MRLVLFTILIALLLTACSDSDNSSTPHDDDQQNQAPVVDAGDDVDGLTGEQIALDGSVVDDGLPSGNLTYLWEKTEGPGTASFTADNSPATTVVLNQAGSYSLRLTADDGELQTSDSVTVSVSDSVVLPTTQDGFSVKQHESGLRLEFVPQSTLADSTDIDWMYRMWNGIAECQKGGAESVPYPAIRLVEELPERLGSDFGYEDAGYLWNYDLERITVLNSDTAFAKGAGQGLWLGEAMSVYMGFFNNDFFPDPGDRNSLECQSWHSGGRHDPAPGRRPLPDSDVIFSLSADVFGETVAISSDTERVDEFTLGYVVRLLEAVGSCHNYDVGNPFSLKTVLVLSDRQADFFGDKWSESGAYTVNQGGRILIDSSDLLDIRTNSEWGFQLHHWINLYLDAFDNDGFANTECRDLSGTFLPPVLPFEITG